MSGTEGKKRGPKGPRKKYYERPILVPISALCQALGVGSDTIIKNIREGKIPGKRVGRWHYIPRSFLEELERLCEVGPEAARKWMKGAKEDA